MVDVNTRYTTQDSSPLEKVDGESKSMNPSLLYDEGLKWKMGWPARSHVTVLAGIYHTAEVAEVWGKGKDTIPDQRLYGTVK